MFDSEWAMDYTLKVFSVVERKLTDPNMPIVALLTETKILEINNQLDKISKKIYQRSKIYMKKVKE